MKIIQPVLVLLLLFWAVSYFRRLNARSIDRIVVIAVVALGLIFLIDPDISTRIARWFGVGRGVDFLFYIALFCIGFLLLSLFAAVRDLRTGLTDVTRAVALLTMRAGQASGGPLLLELPAVEPTPTAATPQARFRPDRWQVAMMIIAGIGIAHHAVVIYNYGGFSYDQLFQLAETRTFVDGHSFRLTVATVPDLAHAQYVPVVGWPVGYPFLLSGLLEKGSALVPRVILLDIICVALLFVALAYLFDAARPLIGNVAALLAVAWCGIAASPIYHIYGAEIVSLSLFIAGVALSIRIFRQPRNQAIVAIISGLLIGGAASSRFSYWPLLPVVPMCIFYFGYRNRIREWKQAAVIQMASAAVPVAFVATYHLRATGHLTFLSSYYSAAEATGFFWGQLRSIIPFPAGVLGLRDAAAIAGPSALPGILWISSALIVSALLFESWMALRRDVEQPPVEIQFLFLSSGAAAIITFAMLVYLNIRHIAGPNNFVYINEARYYAPLLLAMLLGVAAILSRLSRGAQWRRPAVGAACTILFALTIFHWSHTGWWSFLHQNQYPMSLRLFSEIIAGQVESAAKKGQPVIYIDSDPPRLRMASMAGALELRYDTWAQPSLVSAKGVSLILACQGTCPAQYLPLREEMIQQGAAVISTLNAVDFVEFPAPGK